MAEVVPADQFLEWYPGWTPALTASPWVAEPSGPFVKEDEDRFWFIDFHWPRGFSPLERIEDGCDGGVVDLEQPDE